MHHMGPDQFQFSEMLGTDSNREVYNGAMVNVRGGSDVIAESYSGLIMHRACMV